MRLSCYYIVFLFLHSILFIDRYDTVGEKKGGGILSPWDFYEVNFFSNYMHKMMMSDELFIYLELLLHCSRTH